MALDKDAVTQIGEPLETSVHLMESGFSAKARTGGFAGAAGALGVVVGHMLAKTPGEADPAMVETPGGVFLAATPNRVVVFGVQARRLRAALGPRVVELSAGDVAGIAHQKAALGVVSVAIALTDGRVIVGETPKMNLKKVEQMARILGTTVSAA